MNQHDYFDFSDLDAHQRYKLLIGTVVPRPIAWVTTVCPDGVMNAAPYSFFNCLSADPPILALGIENHSDMSFKDTARNIRMTEQFTVNIVDYDSVKAMSITAIDFPPNVSELDLAAVTAVPGTKVICPRIQEAPVALECRRHTTLSFGKSREIILGEVLAVHIREGLVETDRLHVNQSKLDAVGRMGGNGYATTRDYFDLQTPSLEEWNLTDKNK